MIREIKTTLALDGEKAFKQELQAASREMRVMNADLKAMAAEFDATGDEQRYFTQRAETMAAKIKQQEAIVEALERAVKDSAGAFDDGGAKADGYRIKLSNAKAAMYKMRKEAEDAERELEELGRDTGKVGRQIQEGIGDAAEEAGNSLDRMFEKVSGDMQALKSSVAFQTTLDVGGFVIDGINAVTDFVNENAELNRQLSIAKYNVEKYDFQWGEALSLMYKASAITGNFDGAQEAITNLVNAGYETEGLLASTVDALLGAFLRTGGSLSFESLAEDFRASVVSRTPTGTYAEVLEEVLQDVAIEEAEKALQSAENAEDAINIALGYLTKGGLQTEAKSYEEQYGELMKQQIQNQQLTVAWAELAAEVQPAVTKVIEITQILVDGLTKSIKLLKDFDGLSKEQLKQDQPEFSSALESGQLDTFGGTIEYFWNQLFGGGSAGAEAIDANTAAGGKIVPIWQITGQESAQAYWDAFNDEFMASEYAEAYMQAFQNLGVDTEAAEKSGANAGEAAAEGMDETKESAKTAGKNMITMLANGIAEAAPGAIQNAMAIANQVNSILNMVAVPWYMQGSAMQAIQRSAGSGTAVINIDGQKAGEMIYSGVSEAAGRATYRTMVEK